MKKLIIHFLASAATLLPWCAPAQPDPYSSLWSKDFGEQGEARSSIEKSIREGGPAEYARIEAKLLEALEQPQASPGCKKFVCDTLRIVGSAASVGPMVRLLGDDASADLARLALESLPGQTVDDALSAAAKSATGRTRIGLIQTLATRKHPAVLDLAGQGLGSGDVELTRVALQVLGRLGGERALEVLRATPVPPELSEVREMAMIDAIFQLAQSGGGAQADPLFEEQYRTGKNVSAVVAALNGLVEVRGEQAAPLLLEAIKDSRLPVALAAARAAVQLRKPGLSGHLTASLPAFSPPLQVAALRSLSILGDRSALPTVKELLGSLDEEVKAEAALALETLGDASVVESLVSLAAGTDAVASAAQQTLARLNTPGVGEALAKLLDHSDPGQVRVAALALKMRADRSALPRLLQLAGSDHPARQSTALEALDGLAGTEEMPALMALLRNAGDSQREKVASALWKSTRLLGTEDERFVKLWTGAAGDPDPVKMAILGLGSVAGGAGPLEVISGMLVSGNNAVKEAAARTLFQWPNDRALPPLVDLIRSTSQAKQKILATRAVVRLMNDRTCTWQPARKIEALEQVLPLMEREEEKKMIRGALEKLRAPTK